MDSHRSVKKISRAQRVLEGAGVSLYRALGFDRSNDHDPFLLLDDFRSDDPREYIKGFPWHPHRGIETITYVTKGRVSHQDSLSNKGEIGPGDIQWMTAGSGIYHQEMPQGDSHGSMHGFQLWANLPAKDKMMPPRYQDITSEEIPMVNRKDGVKVKVIAGTYQGTTGPVKDVVISPEYFDVSVPGALDFSMATEPENSLMLYIHGGSGMIYSQSEEIHLENRMLLLLDRGTSIKLKSHDDGLRFLYISGRPIGEPVAWRGPIVMNTQEELQRAYDELANGSFIKDQ